MQRTISFKFDAECFKVQLDVIQKEGDETSEPNPTFLFLQFLKEKKYIDSIDENSYSSQDLKFVVFSNHADIKSKEIKEKAQSLGLEVIVPA